MTSALGWKLDTGLCAEMQPTHDYNSASEWGKVKKGCEVILPRNEMSGKVIEYDIFGTLSIHEWL